MEPKKLSEQELAGIWERRAGQYGLDKASEHGQRQFSDWFWQRLFADTLSDVDALLSHNAALEADNAALAGDSIRQGDVTGAFINRVEQEKAELAYRLGIEHGQALMAFVQRIEKLEAGIREALQHTHLSKIEQVLTETLKSEQGEA